MVIHANAALTVKQRQELQELPAKGQSLRALAKRFGVDLTTVQRWAGRDSPLDRTTAPLHLKHGTCMPYHPWQNGFVERSHRTDNEELFHVIRFSSSEERRYQLRLWEGYYNCHRPHQGLGGLTPLEVYRRDYRLETASCMLM